MKAGLGAIVFVDGQNLFHGAQSAFGQKSPTYDVRALAQELAGQQGEVLTQARFYSGVPSRHDNQYWHDFWASKLLQMSRSKVEIFTRELRYRTVTMKTDGTAHTARVPQEKGVDIRIALDLLRLTTQKAYDTAIIVSQDQDFSEVAGDVKAIAREQGRRIRLVSAYPSGGEHLNKRGINGMDWLPITWDTYRKCLDAISHLPSRKQGDKATSASAAPQAASLG